MPMRKRLAKRRSTNLVTSSVRSVPRCARRIVSLACDAVRPVKVTVRLSGSPARAVYLPENMMS